MWIRDRIVVCVAVEYTRRINSSMKSTGVSSILKSLNAEVLAFKKIEEFYASYRKDQFLHIHGILSREPINRFVPL